MSHHGPVFHTGEFRDCGFSGVDDGRYFQDEIVRPRKYTYDDPDYKPGHGAGDEITFDFETMTKTVAPTNGLYGPELPKEFVRNPEQRTDLLGKWVVNERHWLDTLFQSTETPSELDTDSPETEPTHVSDENPYAQALRLDRIARNTENFIAGAGATGALPVEESASEKSQHGYEIHVDRETGDWTVTDF